MHAHTYAHHQHTRTPPTQIYPINTHTHTYAHKPTHTSLISYAVRASLQSIVPHSSTQSHMIWYLIPRVGQSRIFTFYMTVYLGILPAKNTVHAPYIRFCPILRIPYTTYHTKFFSFNTNSYICHISFTTYHTNWLSSSTHSHTPLADWCTKGLVRGSLQCLPLLWGGRAGCAAPPFWSERVWSRPLCDCVWLSLCVCVCACVCVWHCVCVVPIRTNGKYVPWQLFVMRMDNFLQQVQAQVASNVGPNDYFVWIYIVGG